LSPLLIILGGENFLPGQNDCAFFSQWEFRGPPISPRGGLLPHWKNTGGTLFLGTLTWWRWLDSFPPPFPPQFPFLLRGTNVPPVQDFPGGKKISDCSPNRRSPGDFSLRGTFSGGNLSNTGGVFPWAVFFKKKSNFPLGEILDNSPFFFSCFFVEYFPSSPFFGGFFKETPERFSPWREPSLTFFC